MYDIYGGTHQSNKARINLSLARNFHPQVSDLDLFISGMLCGIIKNMTYLILPWFSAFRQIKRVYAFFFFFVI